MNAAHNACIPNVDVEGYTALEVGIYFVFTAGDRARHSSHLRSLGAFPVALHDAFATFRELDSGRYPTAIVLESAIYIVGVLEHVDIQLVELG